MKRCIFLGFFQTSKMPRFYLCSSGLKFADNLFVEYCNIRLKCDFSVGRCAPQVIQIHSEGRHHFKSLCLLTVMGITHRIVNYEHLQFSFDSFQLNEMTFWC